MVGEMKGAKNKASSPNCRAAKTENYTTFGE